VRRAPAHIRQVGARLRDYGASSTSFAALIAAALGLSGEQDLAPAEWCVSLPSLP
jgi:hypothetical protein